MLKLTAATGNRGKIAEIKRILAGLPFIVISMDEAGIKLDTEETGATFSENALIKARALHAVTGGYVIADDSGLETDALGGMPGVFSARFAGEGASDKEKNDKLLTMLEGIPEERRTARFVCAIAAIMSDGTEIVTEGKCEGIIAFKPSGEGGFGYDPIFFVPDKNMTTAEMSGDDKDKISHRGKALRLMAEELKKRL